MFAAALLLSAVTLGSAVWPFGAGEQQTLDPHRTEIGVVPAIGYDSDSGFGFGFASSLARFAPARDPYDWRLQAVGFLTWAT